MPKHIARLILVIIVASAAALVAKTLLVTDTFYDFGHYRGDSVIQIAAREPAYQAPSYCEPCHAERVAEWSAQSHKTVICEVCHGAAQGHPENGKLPIPADTVKLCSLCHEAMPGRPKAQPQIDVASHSAGRQCIACHDPHAPKIATTAASVAGNAAAGKARAASCAGCHGPQGMSANDTWPNLAGQHAVYLARILGAYKSGDQRDVVMTPIAQELSDADVQDLAVYYAQLGCAPAGRPAATDEAAAGRALAKNCVACHGDNGTSANPAWPSLAAQKPGYIVNALKALRAGLRKDPMMAGVARGLSDADIANLAAHYAQQSCEPAKQARRLP